MSEQELMSRFLQAMAPVPVPAPPAPSEKQVVYLVLTAMGKDSSSPDIHSFSKEIDAVTYAYDTMYRPSHRSEATRAFLEDNRPQTVVEYYQTFYDIRNAFGRNDYFPYLSSMYDEGDRAFEIRICRLQ